MSRKNHNTKTDLNLINAIRLTQNVWEDSVQDESSEHWETITRPHEVLDFAYNILEEIDRTEDTNVNVRVIHLDDEYLEWLEKNELKNGNDARIQYVRMLSNEKMDELMVKYGDNCEVQCIIVKVDSCLSEEYKTLPKNVRKSLESYIKQVTGLSDVYVPGEVFPYERIADIDCDALWELLVDSALEYFNTGKTKLHVSNYRGYSELEYYIIPFVTRRQFTSATLSYDDIFSDTTLSEDTETLDLNLVTALLLPFFNSNKLGLSPQTLYFNIDYINNFVNSCETGFTDDIVMDFYMFMLKRLGFEVCKMGKKSRNKAIDEYLNLFIDLLKDEDFKKDLKGSITSINKRIQEESDANDKIFPTNGD